MNNRVRALATSGSDLYAGGEFTTAGNKVSAHAARANIGGSSVVLGGKLVGLAYSPATGFSLNFSDATPGQPYRIETSTSLAVGSWTDFANFTYSGPIVIHDASAVSTPKKFYRTVTP